MTQPRTQLTEQYLRILTSGPSSQADYGLAVKLINEGYATGSARIARSHEDYGKVLDLVNFGVTTKGDLLAAQLEGQTRRARIKDMAIKGAIAVVSAAFGIGVTLVEKALIGC